LEAETALKTIVESVELLRKSVKQNPNEVLELTKRGKFRCCLHCSVGSISTPDTIQQPTEVDYLIKFGNRLLQRGNRESKIQRKLRYFNTLHSTPEEMATQYRAVNW
jgi:hypothetical protein